MRTTSRESSAIEEKAKQILDRLTHHHDEGRRLSEQLRSPSNTRSASELAAEHRVNYRTSRNERAFARHYTKEELSALRALKRKGSNLPLHWGYIPHLIAVGKKKGKAARRRFEKQAAANNWTVPELQQAILDAYPREPGHGRRMKPPPTPEAALDLVALQADGMAKRLRHTKGHLQTITASRRSRDLRERASIVAKSLFELAKQSKSFAAELERW